MATTKKQLQEQADALENQVQQYQIYFQQVQELFKKETEERNAREYEMLKRIYPYLANELDALREHNAKHQQQEQEG